MQLLSQSSWRQLCIISLSTPCQGLNSWLVPAEELADSWQSLHPSRCNLGKDSPLLTGLSLKKVIFNRHAWKGPVYLGCVKEFPVLIDKWIVVCLGHLSSGKSLGLNGLSPLHQRFAILVGPGVVMEIPSAVVHISEYAQFWHLNPAAEVCTSVVICFSAAK